MSNKDSRTREQDYQITSYDDKTIGKGGNLNGSHSELEESCMELVKNFQKEYKGRIDIKVIIR